MSQGWTPVKPVRFLAPGQVVSRKAPRASATTPTRTYAVEEPKDDKDSGNKADLTVRKVPVLHDRCEAREIKALAFLLDHMSISMETRNVLQRYMYNPGHPRGKPDAREDLMAMSLHALAYGASWRIGQFVDDRRLAWQHYITALSKADAMISDPALALSDEVILSVKAFELYELLCGDDLNLFGVGLHILGSVALVRHRGRKNFETLHATLVFHSVRMVLCATMTRFLNSFALRTGLRNCARTLEMHFYAETSPSRRM
ncbi:hypothetical protein PRZ48_005447 [Zasmidium cellare]|uniref:Uncharacterized protein n=1 Tax=Zasmidium cellare TaxID=395010 RepID=A0ABR0ETW3_ZASCE|nr:hypothetical protein PRZ48_005447 [Zasmidium cellare]